MGVYVGVHGNRSVDEHALRVGFDSVVGVDVKQMLCLRVRETYVARSGEAPLTYTIRMRSPDA